MALGRGGRRKRWGEVMATSSGWEAPTLHGNAGKDRVPCYRCSPYVVE